MAMRLKHAKERLLALAFAGVTLIPVFVLTLFLKGIKGSEWEIWTQFPIIWPSIALTALVVCYVYGYRAFIQPVTVRKLLRTTLTAYVLIILGVVFIFTLWTAIDACLVLSYPALLPANFLNLLKSLDCPALLPSSFFGAFLFFVMMVGVLFFLPLLAYLCILTLLFYAAYRYFYKS